MSKDEEAIDKIMAEEESLRLAQQLQNENYQEPHLEEMRNEERRYNQPVQYD